MKRPRYKIISANELYLLRRKAALAEQYEQVLRDVGVIIREAKQACVKYPDPSPLVRLKARIERFEVKWK